jgi:hypothetical protein
MLCAFPGGVRLDTLTYEQWFGLWLNVPRVQGKMTHAFFQALNAFHADRLTADFFEPVSANRKEAENKAFDWNAAKDFARAVARKR